MDGVTSTSVLSEEVRPLYDQDYLMAAVSMTGLDQFTDLRQAVQNGQRGNSVEVPILEQMPPQPNTLSEVSDVTPQQMVASKFVVTLAEYGNAVQVTRFLKTVAYPDVYQQAAEACGQNQAESIDFVLRPIFGSGQRVMYPGGITGRTGLSETNKMTSALIQRAVTLARLTKTPSFEDGFYASVLHPNVHYDLLQDSLLTNLGTYQREELLFNNEIGVWGGLRFCTMANWKAFWGVGASSTFAAAASTTLASPITPGENQIVVAAATNIAIGDWIAIQDGQETGNTWSDTNESGLVTNIVSTTLTVQFADPGPDTATKSMGCRYAHAAGTVVKSAVRSDGSTNVYPVPIFGPQSVTKLASDETGPFGLAITSGPFDILQRFINHGWWLIAGWGRTTERWIMRLEVGGTY
jgi:N4-gp56 family major capsid protein